MFGWTHLRKVVTSDRDSSRTGGGGVITVGWTVGSPDSGQVDRPMAIVIAGAPSLQAGINQVQAGDGAPDGVILTSDAFATVLPWFP